MKTNLKQNFLENQIGHCTRVAHAIVRPYYSKYMSSLDLKPSEFATLSLIYENPGVAQGQLAEAIIITPQNMANLIDKLESRKLLRRENSEEDKRAYSLYLTEDGLKITQEALDTVKNLEDMAYNMLNSEEKQLLIRLLDKIITND